MDREVVYIYTEALSDFASRSSPRKNHVKKNVIEKNPTVGNRESSARLPAKINIREATPRFQKFMTSSKTDCDTCEQFSAQNLANCEVRRLYPFTWSEYKNKIFFQRSHSRLQCSYTMYSYHSSTYDKAYHDTVLVSGQKTRM